MTPSYRQGCITSAKTSLRDISKALKTLEKLLTVADDQKIKLAYLNIKLLENYIKKQMPVDVVSVLSGLTSD